MSESNQQRPCRVGDTVMFGQYGPYVIQDTAAACWINSKEAPVTVTRCGQCGKAVPSECQCVFEDSETGGK